MDYTNEEIKTEAKVWFESYAGNYARCLLERTEENIYRAWVVFADLALGIHFEDGTKGNIKTFKDLFRDSSQQLNISVQQLSEGMREFDEILDLVY